MKQWIVLTFLVLTAVTAPCERVSGQTVKDSADAAWVNGDNALAKRLYQAVLAMDSTDARAMHRIALIHAWAGEFTQSLDLFHTLLRLHPTEDDARVDKARVLAWSGNTRAALATLDSVTNRNPRNVDALQARAQFLSWAGDYEQALRGYEQILKITPDNRSIEIDRARVLAWSENFERARAAYDSLLRRDPTDRDAVIGLGNVLTLSGKTDSARAIFQRMIAADREDIDALRGLARAATWEGRLREGESLWREAVSKAPNNVDVLAGYAQALRWEGRDAAAYEILMKSRAISPTNADTRAQLDLIRMSFAPRVLPAVTYETDSDQNTAVTSSVGAAFRPAHRLEVRADGYRRQVGMTAGVQPDHSTVAGSVGLWAQIEPGWAAQLAVGASHSDVEAIPTRATMRIGLSTPGWYRVAASLAFAREALDGSATLVERRVYTDDVSLDARTSFGGINLSGAVGAARYKGVVSGESNSRWNVVAVATKNLTRAVTVGARSRAFGFSQDLNDGYFDPDFYGVVELTSRYLKEGRHWSLNAEAAPGVQKVRSTGEASASYRIGARLAYIARAGRTIGVNATYARSGLQQLSPTAGSDYRYSAIGVTAGWVF